MPAEVMAGSFCIASAFTYAGWKPSSIIATNDFLYGAIVGTVLSGEHPKVLGVREWGEVIELDPNPIQAGAELIYVQALARFQAKADVHYWQEMLYDFESRRETHVENIVYVLEQMMETLEGLQYAIEPVWTTLHRLAPNPDALIVVNPPKNQNNFYNTLGKITWDLQPPNAVEWKAEHDIPTLIDESADWNATVVAVEVAPHGECSHHDPVFAQSVSSPRAYGKGKNAYVCTNKPDKVRKLLGLTTRARTGIQAAPLPNPIMPPDYEITEESVCQVIKLPAKCATYYKDLWIHKIDTRQATGEFAVIIDGYMAGAAGFNYVPVPNREEDTDGKKHAGGELGSIMIVLLYAVGPHHNVHRLTRLMKMQAINRPILETMMFPWFVASATHVMTKNFTPHPEAKEHRGIMTLTDRQTHPRFGYVLTYKAEIEDRSVEEAFQLWLKKEREWLKSRAKSESGPKKRQRASNRTTSAS